MPICDQGVETIIHSLIFCGLARQVWDNWKECPLNLKSDYLDISDIALTILADGTSQDLENFFCDCLVPLVQQEPNNF